MMLVLAIGMSGCGAGNDLASDAGLCLAARPDVAALRRALLAHPETPAAVGEAGADLVIGIEGACG